jgi:hypothetical protein
MLRHFSRSTSWITTGTRELAMPFPWNRARATLAFKY